jgi:hypothetical protein
MRRLFVFIALSSFLFYTLMQSERPPSPTPVLAEKKPAIQAKQETPAPPPPKEAPKPTYSPIGGCEQYRSELAKYPGWDVRTMLAIMQAESSCRSDATGDGHIKYIQNGREYGYSVSLLQVRILPGREACDSHDPIVNIQCAHGIWKGQGYRAWSVYSNQKYLRHLTSY